LITIVIPVYNGGKKLCRALDSALDQIDGMLAKVVVINNASTDETKAVLDSYNNSNLFIFNYEDNVDMWANHNRAFDHIEDGHCLFLHGDDYLEQNAISNLIKSIESDSDANNTIYWGYSRFADFSNILIQNGFLVNVGFAGERAFIPFTKQGLTPSGTCYPVKRLQRKALFYTNGTTRFASDSISMIRWACYGFRFKMLDYSIVVRTGATTGAPVDGVARNKYFDALNDVFFGSDLINQKRMAQIGLTCKSSDRKITWFSQYCLSKKLIRKNTYYKQLGLFWLKRFFGSK